MNLTGKPPLGLKEGKAAKDPDYLAKVRALPCCICQAWGMPQTHPTQAHHPICERHGNEKTPDCEAIPLCEGHHQGDFDTTKIAIHRDRAAWVEWFGSDREYIAITQDKIERTKT
jgi:hypothetical protein